MLGLNNKGNATLASNLNNRNEKYHFEYAPELNDICCNITSQCRLMLKRNFTEYQIDNILVPEIKKKFWKVALQYGTGVRFLKNRLECGRLNYLNNEFEINAFKSEDYIKDGILIRGITYHIRIEEKQKIPFQFSCNPKEDDVTWTKLTKLYKDWCTSFDVQMVSENELRRIKENFLFMYLEKDLINFISKIFKEDEISANNFYSYITSIENKNGLFLSVDHLKLLNQLRIKLYNMKFESKLKYNKDLMIFEKVCYVDTYALKTLKGFIKQNVPTIGLAIDYAHQIKYIYGEVLINIENNESELVEDFFFYWFFKINKRYLNNKVIDL
ncbi:hypothetical protein FC676_11410 [Bacillus cereus]|uniref:hypothetical protein n=1 Tax=Bacillus cereus TaxID=1396 RepID=UPI0010BEE613|nr:hypothetical protein [Bacillus cereus]TKH73414.1 hypothetical protein FC676_11410 [Bacillus cereus]